MLISRLSQILKLTLAVILCGLLLTGCVAGGFDPDGWAGPTISDGYVYVISLDGEFLAVDMETRDITELTPQIEEQPSSLFGCQGGSTPDLIGYGTPAIANGIAYIGNYDGEIYALNVNGGAEIWRYEVDGPIVGNPALSGSTLVIASGDEVYAFDAQKGALLWKEPFNAAGKVWSNPVIFEDRVYFGSLGHKLYAIDLESGQEIWRRDFDGPITSTPLIVGSSLYIGTFESKLYALDATTGDPKWDKPFGAKDWFWSTPAYNEGIIYAGSLDHNVYAIDAVTGKAKWSTPAETAGKIRAAAVIAGNVLVVASKTNHGPVYGLDLETGMQKWAPRDLGKIYADPWVEGTTVYLLNRDNTLFALDAETGNQLWSRSLDLE